MFCLSLTLLLIIESVFVNGQWSVGSLHFLLTLFQLLFVSLYSFSCSLNFPLSRLLTRVSCLLFGSLHYMIFYFLKELSSFPFTVLLICFSLLAL